MTSRRALLLINAASRRGDDDLSAAIRHITDDGWELTIFRPQSVDEMRSLISERARDMDRVVLAGGDGTVHAALPAVLEANAVLAVLPLGTGNDLAAALGIPEDLRAAAAVFTGESERHIDVGFVNETPFINAVQIGLGAELRSHLDSRRKRRWGALGYLWAAMESLREDEPFDAVIRCGDEHEGAKVRLSHITVANGERFGGRLELGERAVLESGQLVVKALKPRVEWSPTAMAAAVLRGGPPPEDHLYSWRTDKLEIDATPSQAVTADGEPVGRTPLTCRVLPRALRVLAPSAKGRELQTREHDLTRTHERRAVDTVLARASELSHRLELAAEIVDKADATDELAVLLRHLGARQQERTERLRDAIRAIGVLPHEEDPDRQDISLLFSRLRAALARDESRVVVDGCLQAEEDLEHRIHEALDEDLPDELKPPLEAMEAEVQRARERLDAELRRAQSPP